RLMPHEKTATKPSHESDQQRRPPMNNAIVINLDLSRRPSALERTPPIRTTQSFEQLNKLSHDDVQPEVINKPSLKQPETITRYHTVSVGVGQPKPLDPDL